MKKFLVGLLCILCLFGCSRNKANDKEISINIKIVDEISDEELYNGTLTKKATTLADALEAAKGVIDVTMEDSEYGKYITGMLGLEQTDSIFWVYESDNNKSCIDAGMCMGISDTIIEDGDNFVFKYTDTFE